MPNINNSKRLVFFDATLQSGGAERVISILAKHLLQCGYHVELLLYHDQPVFYNMPANLKIISVKRETGSKNLLKNILWMRRFFKENVDIIISFLAPFNMLALVAHFGLKSKIIVADRNDPHYIPSNFFLRKLRDILYLLADSVVLQTKRNKEYFNSKIQAKSTVIYNPVDLEQKQGQALRTAKKDKIVCVGRLIPQKNQKILLEAFARIKENFPSYNIVFYGQGPLKNFLQDKAKQLVLSDKVQFAGNVKNIFDEISDAKLFVLTSDFEGMPNALIEAMCLGLPVISTDVSGARELIENGKSGFIVPKNSPKELAEIMQKVLSDNLLQKQLGQQAVKLNDILKSSRILEQWTKLIEKMGKNKCL